MKILSFLLILLCINITAAQQTGLVEYKSLGISFSVPPDWKGQEVEEGFLIGSNTIPGFVLLMANSVTTMVELEAEAQQGISDESGNALHLISNIEKINQNTIGGQYEGMLEWQPAKAYIIGMINPLGSGVTIIAATTSDKYSDTHKQIGKQVAQSVKFFKPILPPIAKEWEEKLKNARLTYMASSYSNDGGHSSKNIIDLCAQGYFNQSSSNSNSFDTASGFGSFSSGGQGAGSWEVVSDGQGQPVLQLHFRSGEVSEYVITYEDSKTYLNGTRYFRTYGEYADDGPDCY